jgi:hypothetical protein
MCWTFVACAVSGFSCRAEDLTVRVINVKNGQAVRDLPIWLFFGDKNLEGPLKAKTEADGGAVFHLPDPLPKRVLVDTEASGGAGSCSPAEFSTLELIEHGVVSPIYEYRKCDPKGKLKGRFKARPREVIIFVKFLKWWERMQT